MKCVGHIVIKSLCVKEILKFCISVWGSCSLAIFAKIEGLNLWPK